MTDSRTGNYANNVNSWLQMAGGLDLTGYTRATLSWWENYSTESGWDYCYPEISLNGGATWDSTFIPRYSGSSGGWSNRSADLTPLLASAANFTFRFRLRSDSYIVDDGWYVDDVLLTGYTPAGIAGEPAAAGPGRISLACWPSPASSRVHLGYSLPEAGMVRLEVFDVAGRLVSILEKGRRQAGDHRSAWDCRDASGRPAANGTYFFRLSTGGGSAIGRIALVR